MKMSHVFRILYKGLVLKHDDEFKWFKLQLIGHLKSQEPCICQKICLGD
jgi:hypothetical protein